jgi:hypothetical protein
MAGLQLPLLLNLWGLLWPVFHPSSFEKHHTKWHRVSYQAVVTQHHHSIAAHACLSGQGMDMQQHA